MLGRNWKATTVTIMGGLTAYQRLIEFQQITESRESASSRALREENTGFRRLDQLLRALVRNWRPIVGFSVLGLMLGLGVALLQKPVYRAKTVVEIKVPSGDFFKLRQVDPSPDGRPLQSESDLQTQLRLLDSDGLLWTAGVKSGLLESPE